MADIQIHVLLGVKLGDTDEADEVAKKLSGQADADSWAFFERECQFDIVFDQVCGEYFYVGVIVASLDDDPNGVAFDTGEEAVGKVRERFLDSPLAGYVDDIGFHLVRMVY